MSDCYISSALVPSVLTKSALEIFKVCDKKSVSRFLWKLPRDQGKAEPLLFCRIFFQDVDGLSIDTLIMEYEIKPRKMVEQTLEQAWSSFPKVVNLHRLSWTASNINSQENSVYLWRV